ncbi:MAG: protein kinase, partial [Acidobacteriota bacterium]
NILVTPAGVPKLLDFGLAKVLSPELPADPASRTATALRMLTPDYASPEQVRGERITTATDVYSLGMVLFELLTGRRPYQITHHTPEEIARVVCEVGPERPPTSAHVPADLTNILLMALRKEPQRRYGSVDQLADDIRRYLAGLPVAARKDTFTYRAGKFLRRHRAGVAAAALVVVAVVVGVSATVWQARVAERERARAERRYQDLRKLASSLLFELDATIVDLPGATAARELLVKRALEYLSILEQDSAGDLSVQRELAVALMRVGDVQSRGYGLDLGDISGALESFHKALLIRQKLVDADPNNLQDQDDLADSLLHIAQVMGQMGDATDYIAFARQAVTIREVLVAADPSRASLRAGLAAAYETLGNALMREADLPAMLEVFNKLQALRETLATADPSDPRARCDLAEAYWSQGLAQTLIGERETALVTFKKAEAIEEVLAEENPASERHRSTLMRTYTQIGGNLNALGQRPPARAYLQRAVHMGETLFAGDPKSAEIRHRLAEAYRDLGGTLSDAGKLTEAILVLEKARDLLERWSRANPSNVQIAVTLAGVYEGMGVALERLASAHRGSSTRSSLGHARAWYQRSLDVWHDLAARDRLARLYRTRTEAVAEAVVRCDAALVAAH